MSPSYLQAPRDLARVIVQFPNGATYAIRARLTDFRGTIDEGRDGRHRHAGQARDALHGVLGARIAGGELITAHRSPFCTPRAP